jgi:hypothetical protein
VGDAGFRVQVRDGVFELGFRLGFGTGLLVRRFGVELGFGLGLCASIVPSMKSDEFEMARAEGGLVLTFTLAVTLKSEFEISIGRSI